MAAPSPLVRRFPGTVMPTLRSGSRFDRCWAPTSMLRAVVRQSSPLLRGRRHGLAGPIPQASSADSQAVSLARTAERRRSRVRRSNSSGRVTSIPAPNVSATATTCASAGQGCSTIRCQPRRSASSAAPGSFPQSNTASYLARGWSQAACSVIAAKVSGPGHDAAPGAESSITPFRPAQASAARASAIPRTVTARMYPRLPAARPETELTRQNR